MHHADVAAQRVLVLVAKVSGLPPVEAARRPVGHGGVDQCGDDVAQYGRRGGVVRKRRLLGASVVGEEIFEPASTDFTSAIQALLATNPDALVVISFDEIKTIAEQLAGQGFDFSKLYGVDGNYGVIGEADTNVDIAGAQFTNPGVLATEDFQAKLQDLVAEQGQDPLTVFSYAAESHDATVLSALAALKGGATDGATIKANLQDVSEGGEKCESFADCAKLLADDADADIDYDGVSGPISWDENGDETEAFVSIFQYSAGNKTEGVDQVAGKLE